MTELSSLSNGELQAYLQRIGHAGELRADLATLTALHRAHQAAITFENLDVQLGNPPSMDPDAIFAKLVRARRGGWCYEQNGLFGRVLATLGFAVTRLSGGVMREVRGDEVLGSHLCLKVMLDREYLVDVGFAGLIGAPLPLTTGRHDMAPILVDLAPIADGFWRLTVELGDSPLSYDFRNEPADEALLQALCDFQGRDAESLFVQNLVIQRRLDDVHLMLRGKVFTRTDRQGGKVRELGSAAELVEVLRDAFALDLPEAGSLWQAVCDRHEALFGVPEPVN